MDSQQDEPVVLRYTIDRHEDNGWSVLERDDGETFNVPTAWLPSEALEGHVLRLELETDEKESRLHFFIDEEAGQERLERVTEIRERLRRRSQDRSGDIDL